MPSIPGFALFHRQNNASVAFESRDDFHVFLRQFKVKKCGILFNTRRCHRFGNDHNLTLDLPTEQNLSHGFAILLSHRYQARIFQKLGIIGFGPRTIRTSQRTVGGQKYSTLFAEFLQLFLAQVRLTFHLIGHRFDLKNAEFFPCFIYVFRWRLFHSFGSLE